MSSKLETVLLLKDVSKSFGDVKAARDVCISIDSGEIFALIGPNGSGKTTLVKMITGLLLSDKGVIKIGGVDITKNPTNAKRLFGYLPDDPTPYDYLTGREFISLTGQLRGLSEMDIKTRIKDLENVFPLGEIFDQQMGQYSRGNRQKIAFLAALIGEPKILVIDEPIVGLDPASIEIFGKELKKFTNNGGAVLMTTHILDFAREFADRVGLLYEGELIKEVKVSKNTDLGAMYQLTNHE